MHTYKHTLLSSNRGVSESDMTECAQGCTHTHTPHYYAQPQKTANIQLFHPTEMATSFDSTKPTG